MAAEDATGDGTGTGPPAADATVLLVDDEESVLDTYRLYLETEGYEVLTATNGGEALVQLDPDVDVVLLDRRMPGMSGDEVLEHLRDWGTDTRVAMITAVDPGADIVEMAFDDYLTKPIEKAELLATVEQLLLFDRYETLLGEYHAVTKKYATLRSNVETAGTAADDELDALEQRRAAIRDELGDTIDAFTDEEVAEVFETVHARRE